MKKIILWDVDNTLLDFYKAQSAALKYCFSEFGLGKIDDNMIGIYSKINKKYWKKLETGELKKKEILVKRFEEFFDFLGIESSIAEEFNNVYQNVLGETCVPIDDSINLLKKLKEMGYIQCVVTNGTKVAQDKKLFKSGIIDIVDGVFISEVVGHEKPSIEFFKNVFDEIGNKNLEEYIIVGDSLSSDIDGGNRAGIDSCWFNPNGEKENKIKPQYSIENLWDILKILEINDG